MMVLFEAALWALTAVTLAPMLWLCVECGAALAVRPRASRQNQTGIDAISAGGRGGMGDGAQANRRTGGLAGMDDGTRASPFGHSRARADFLAEANCRFDAETVCRGQSNVDADGHADFRADADCRVVVLVPAHDEELLIGATLEHLQSRLADYAELLVIADNCTDATARLAAARGATVLERHDLARRGKSYALQHAIDHLAHDPPDVVVVVDADCRVGEHAMARIAALAHQLQRPIQAAYTFLGADGVEEPEETEQAEQAEQAPASRAPIGDVARASASGLARRGAIEPLSHIAAVLLWLKNYVRPLGLSRLGMPCQLTGSGTALPWRAATRVTVGNDALTEDTQLGIDLVLAGYSPLFCPEAEVTSPLPNEARALVGQRRRWEHGYLITMARQIPRLLAAAMRQRRAAPLWLAADLAIPPLSLLAMGWLAALVMAAIAAWRGVGFGPLAALAAGGAITAAIGLAALRRECGDRLTWRVLLSIPWYVVRKVPLYAGFFVRRQREWTRTQRPAAAVGAARGKP